MTLVEEREFPKLHLSGIIVGFIGSILLFIGIFVPFSIAENDPEAPGISLMNSYTAYNVNYAKVPILPILILVAIVSIIIIVCILSLLGQLLPNGFGIKNELPLMILILLFAFVPIIEPVVFASCLSYIILIMNNILYFSEYWALRNSTNQITIGAGLHLTLIGSFLILIAGFILLLVFLWKRNQRNLVKHPEIQLSNTKWNYLRISRIFVSSLGIFSSIGGIFGLALPYTKWIYRAGSGDNKIQSFLRPLLSYYNYSSGTTTYSNYVQLEVVYLMIILALILISSILILLGNFNIGNLPSTISPLCFLVIPLILIPGYSPFSGMPILWQSPFLELLWYLSERLEYIIRSELRYEFLAIDEYYKLSGSANILIASIFITYIISLFSISTIFLEKQKYKIIKQEKEAIPILEKNFETQRNENEEIEEKDQHEFDQEAYENAYKEHHY